MKDKKRILIYSLIGFMIITPVVILTTLVNPAYISKLIFNITYSPADITANWSTYTSTIHGYSLKYPATWTLNESDYIPERDGSITTLVAPLYKYSNSYQDYVITISNNSLGTELYGEKNPYFKKEIIGGYQVLRKRDEPNYSSDIVVFKASDNKYIHITFEPYSSIKPYPNQKDTYEVFNKILSTFKIIDQNRDVVEWKKYEDSKFGFSFQYPAKTSFEARQRSFNIGGYKERLDIQGEIIQTTYDPNEWWPLFGKEKFRGTPGLYTLNSPNRYDFTISSKKVNNVPMLQVNAVNNPKKGGPKTMYDQDLAAKFSVYLIPIQENIIALTVWRAANQKELDTILASFIISDQEKKKPFPKRQINASDKFFDHISYPTAITSIPETDLVGLNCTNYHVTPSSDGSKTYYSVSHYDEIEKESFSIDQNKQHSAIYSKILQTLNRDSLKGITICSAEDGRTFVEYGLPPKDTTSNLFFIRTAYAGGGIGSDVYFGEFKFENNSFRQIAYIPYEKAAYWGCITPIQMSKTNIFYLQCNGGEGGGLVGNYRASIYAIDVSNNSYNRVILCTYIAGVKPDEGIPSCQ